MICIVKGCNRQCVADDPICPTCQFAGAPAYRIVDHATVVSTTNYDAKMPDISTTPISIPWRRESDVSMAEKYPKYYKRIPEGVQELDIYAVCQLFDVTDAALSHALKKIMLPGTRTGGKSRYDDIKEARDTLNRWLELNSSKL